MCNLKNNRMISVRFQGTPFNITVIQVYVPNSNAEKAEVERFYEDLQNLLPLEEGMATHSIYSCMKNSGQRSLEGYSPWGPKESGMNEWQHLHKCVMPT